MSDDSGLILIGSSDRDAVEALSALITREYGKTPVTLAESSDILLEILDKRVDLTIIDTSLGGLSVAKTIQIIRKVRPKTPVIVISDDYSVKTGGKIMEQGVFYYMYKPLDMTSVKEIIDSALRKLARETAEERR